MSLNRALGRNATLAHHLAAWMFVVSLVPVVALYLTYRSTETRLRREASAHLMALSDKSADAIESYAEKKVAAVTSAAREPWVSDAIVSFTDAFAKGGTRSVEYAAMDTRLRGRLADFASATRYYDLMLISREGDVTFSLRGESDLGTNLRTGPERDGAPARVFATCVAELTTSISDIGYYAPSSAPAAFIAAPVVRDGHVLGALLVQLDNRELYATVDERTGLGQTGETVVAGRRGDDATFVLPTRNDSTAAFKRARTLGPDDGAPPFVHAMKRERGAGEALDYRGVAVFAAWQYLPTLRLGVVTKIDSSEVLEPLRSLRAIGLASAIWSLALVALVTALMTRSVASPLSALASAAQRVRGGAFGARVPESGPAEIGALGRAWNEMSADLQASYERLEEEIAERKEAQDRLTAFSEQLELLVAERTGALRSAEEQLHQAQKMEAIGTLAGGVAHDFNNLLSVILSYAELLVDMCKPGDPMREDLEEVRRAAQRGAALTRQLLAFSRRQVLQPKVLEMNEVVAGIETMLRRAVGATVGLDVLLSPTAGRVHADPGQMDQVLLNLVLNARDATPSGGRVKIEIATVELTPEMAAEHVGAAPGRYSRLSVIDSGTGMSAATRARVFEPFFTTKDIGKGTGLGLSTVQGIVAQSGGFIVVESEVDRGSAFHVHLPATTSEAEPAAAPAPPRAKGTETVLLVEDEDAVRAATKAVLTRNGYVVVEACSGADALRVADSRKVIDIVVSDVIMPGMSGAELAERLKAKRPATRILLMSGYTDDALADRGSLAYGVAFLQKPVTPDILLGKVRDTLDAPA